MNKTANAALTWRAPSKRRTKRAQRTRPFLRYWTNNYDSTILRTVERSSGFVTAAAASYNDNHGGQVVAAAAATTIGASYIVLVDRCRSRSITVVTLSRRTPTHTRTRSTWDTAGTKDDYTYVIFYSVSPRGPFYVTTAKRFSVYYTDYNDIPARI